MASVKLIVPAFYSTRDTKTPVIITTISLVLNIVINIVFMQFLLLFAKISLCAGIMGVACWFGNYYMMFTIHSRFFVQLLVFAALILGATVLYLALAWIFRCHEIEEVYGIATRRGIDGGDGYAEP